MRDRRSPLLSAHDRAVLLGRWTRVLLRLMRAPYAFAYMLDMPYGSGVASTRTTVVLDERSRAAAKTLARTLGITPSEAIRRALVVYRDQIMGGVSASELRRRQAAFKKLMELMDGNDPEAEIARLKREDEFF